MDAANEMLSVSLYRTDERGDYRIRAEWNPKEVHGPVVCDMLANFVSAIGSAMLVVHGFSSDGVHEHFEIDIATYPF